MIQNEKVIIKNYAALNFLITINLIENIYENEFPKRILVKYL